MQFMCDNAPEAAEEIRAVYIESMGRTISALFRAYHAQLMKLELQMANRHDLIAVEVWNFFVGFDRRIAPKSRLKRANRNLVSRLSFQQYASRATALFVQHFDC